MNTSPILSSSRQGCRAVPRALAALITIAITAGRVSASSILYFVDGNNGTDEMAAALGTLGPANSVTVATDPLDFASKIASGNYALGIFSAQLTYTPDYSAALAALAASVQGGANRSSTVGTPSPVVISHRSGRPLPLTTPRPPIQSE